ncbi:hypothetical protein PQX77_009634 [Marasmius sp. AFHP31]|nr:hypothetical protein PQX77_009634 [Marasmius sp. AFHP31]
MAAPDPEPSFSTYTNDSSRIQDQDSLEYADEMKAQGNDHFRAGRWEEALASYRVGLGRLPKRKMKKQKQKTPDEDATFDMEREHDSVFGKERESGEEEKEEEKEEEEKEEKEEDVYSQPRAVLNANIAACFMKLGDDKEVVSACSEGLDFHIDLPYGGQSISDPILQLSKTIPNTSKHSNDVQLRMKD